LSWFVKKWMAFVFAPVVLLLCLGFYSGKSLFTAFVERSLQKAIINESRLAEDLQVDLASLSFFSLISGRIHGFSLSASRLAFKNEPAFEELDFSSKGMKIDPAVLIFKRRLEVQSFEETSFSFRLSEKELTAALRLDHPQWESSLKITPAGVELDGKIDVLGRGALPFIASVHIKKESANALRLTPTGLSIAGFNFLTEMLKDYHQELTWIYPINLPWPLKIADFKLNKGFLEMKWIQREEMKEGGGD